MNKWVPDPLGMSNDNRLRCERDCTRLRFDFASTVDTGDYPSFVARFAADREFERPRQMGRGAEAIRRVLDARTTDRVTRHLLHNVRIDITSPTTAGGTTTRLTATMARGRVDGQLRRASAQGHPAVLCVHHGVDVSLYCADPDGNRMGFQTDWFTPNEDTNGFMGGPHLVLNPTGVEFEPEV